MNNFIIYDKEWDILIILDACRFDCFDLIYSNYFNGVLTSTFSSGSATPQWRDANFTREHNDIVYISSNPFIGDTNYYNFTGSELFFKVYPVWKIAWEQNLGTVLPEKITDVATSVIPRNSDKKHIIHYLQPHAPYLASNIFAGFADPKNSSNPFAEMNNKSSATPIRSYIYKKLLKHFGRIKLLGNHPEWFIGQFLGLPPQTPMDAARRKYGKKGLRKLYLDNLHSVLQEVCLLLDNIDTNGKKIIISSDHGELLGEKNMYAHPINSDHEILRKVPWFEWHSNVYKPEKTRKLEPYIEQETEDNISIAHKLKDLGYM